MIIEADYLLWILDNAANIHVLEANSLPGTCASAFKGRPKNTGNRNSVKAANTTAGPGALCIEVSR